MLSGAWVQYRSMSKSIDLPANGGCVCSAIHYQCVEAPLAMFNCRCRECQRASGSTFVTVALLRESKFAQGR
jgi:hypothetical protein